MLSVISFIPSTAQRIMEMIAINSFSLKQVIDNRRTTDETVDYLIKEEKILFKHKTKEIENRTPLSYSLTYYI